VGGVFFESTAVGGVVREGEGGKRCGGDGAVRDASRPAASDVGAGGDRG
jgi:hypothetical protein